SHYVTQPGGALTAFDISYVDSTGLYNLADRSSATVDFINGATNQVAAQAAVLADRDLWKLPRR
ncbi:MAG TPA: hypothetical protein VKT26_02170, partial [Acetobacteraceae bacterium]|nr:hypothetical protein [Acetobacteraceae bacterium]